LLLILCDAKRGSPEQWSDEWSTAARMGSTDSTERMGQHDAQGQHGTHREHGAAQQVSERSG